MPLDPDNDVDNAAWGVVNFIYKADRNGFLRQAPGEPDDIRVANKFYARMVEVVRSPEQLDYKAGSIAAVMGLEGVGPISEGWKDEEAKTLKKVRTARRKLGLQK